MISALSSPAPPVPAVRKAEREKRVGYWRAAAGPKPNWWHGLKRCGDLVCGSLLLVASLPLCALTALGIAIVSPGPVLFVQRRVGKNGQLFPMYKFRTMVDGAHLMHDDVEHLNENDGPALKIANDPRLHPLGTLLRRTSLDELPQLWNVIRGEMSLVGPRPALPHEVESYAPHYHQRLAVLPGISGLWQVSGRADVSFRRWMAMDVWYVRRWSPLVDAWIFLRTLPAVVLQKGAR